MISYRFVTISCQKGVLFIETPGSGSVDKGCDTKIVLLS